MYHVPDSSSVDDYLFLTHKEVYFTTSLLKVRPLCCTVASVTTKHYEYYCSSCNPAFASQADSLGNDFYSMPNKRKNTLVLPSDAKYY